MIVEDDVDDSQEQRPVGNFDAADPETTYEGRKQAALQKVRDMVGEEVTVTRGRGRAGESVTWTVIPESHPDDDDISTHPAKRIGLRHIDTIMRKAGYNVLLAYIFVHISFKDWKLQLAKVNEAVESDNRKPTNKKFRCSLRTSSSGDLVS